MFKLWPTDSAKARKFKAALGISILFDNPIGFPWSLDSAVASSSKSLSIKSANLKRILDLVATGVFDHLKHIPANNVNVRRGRGDNPTEIVQLTKEMHSWLPKLRHWLDRFHYPVFSPKLDQWMDRNYPNSLRLQQIGPQWNFPPAQLNYPASFCCCWRCCCFVLLLQLRFVCSICFLGSFFAAGFFHLLSVEMDAPRLKRCVRDKSHQQKKKAERERERVRKKKKKKKKKGKSKSKYLPPKAVAQGYDDTTQLERWTRE